MDVQDDCCIRATEEQRVLLSEFRGPHDINALRTADFLGRQEYIDQWIVAWLNVNDVCVDALPLCVSETLHCNARLFKFYRHKLKHAIASNRTEWVRSHYIVNIDDPWNFVMFDCVSLPMFDGLSEHCPVPFETAAFVALARRLPIWRAFVREYGPDACIVYAVRSEWLLGVEHCIDEGANIEHVDIVRYCVRSRDIFRCVTQVPTLATQEAYKEFIFQRMLGRVENVPLVEEWFFCNGFKNAIHT